jgi:hypothetical protein
MADGVHLAVIKVEHGHLAVFSIIHHRVLLPELPG